MGCSGVTEATRDTSIMWDYYRVLIVCQPIYHMVICLRNVFLPSVLSNEVAKVTDALLLFIYDENEYQQPLLGLNHWCRAFLGGLGSKRLTAFPRIDYNWPQPSSNLHHVVLPRNINRINRGLVLTEEPLTFDYGWWYSFSSSVWQAENNYEHI